MNPRWTAILAASILPFLGLIDVVLAYVGGNPATFSAVLLGVRAKFPLAAKCIGYAGGLFLGHVFNPAEGTHYPARHEQLARLVCALGPVFYAIILLASGDGQVPKSDLTSPRARLIFGMELLAWIAVGLFIGSTWLAQHPLAWGEDNNPLAGEVR
jgi:hypothetical protein